MPIFLSSGRNAPSKLGDIQGDSIFTEVVLPNGEKARDELPSKCRSISKASVPFVSVRLTFELTPELRTSCVGSPG